MKKIIMIFLGIMVSGSAWSDVLKCAAVTVWCSEDDTKKIILLNEDLGSNSDMCAASKNDVIKALKCKDDKFNVGFTTKDAKDNQNAKITTACHHMPWDKEEYKSMVLDSTLLPDGQSVAYTQHIDPEVQKCIHMSDHVDDFTLF